MSNKTIVFYTPKEVRELKNLKRTTRRGAERNAAIEAWATAHGRKTTGVYAKVCSLKVGKTCTRKKPVVSVKDTQSFVGGTTFRIPIKSIAVVDNHLVITT